MVIKNQANQVIKHLENEQKMFPGKKIFYYILGNYLKFCLNKLPKNVLAYYCKKVGGGGYSQWLRGACPEVSTNKMFDENSPPLKFNR